jgi:predicted nuclease with TOPRIM domain
MNKDRAERISNIASIISSFKDKADSLLNDQMIMLITESKKVRGKQMEKTEEASIKGWLDNFEQDIEDIKNEEEEYKDNLPESLQSGEKADRADQAISALDEAASKLTEVKEKLDDLFSELEEVVSSREEASSV